MSSDASFDFMFDNEETTYFVIGLSVTDGNLSDYAEINLTVSPHQKMKSSMNSQLKLNIYPNPATLSTSVEIIDNDEVKTGTNGYNIKIIDNSGKILYTKKTFDKNIILDTSPYKTGINSILVTSGEKYGKIELVIQLLTKRIINL